MAKMTEMGGGELFSLITFIDGSLSSLQVDTSPAITFAARQPTGRCSWGQKTTLKNIPGNRTLGSRISRDGY